MKLANEEALIQEDHHKKVAKKSARQWRAQFSPHTHISTPLIGLFFIKKSDWLKYIFLKSATPRIVDLATIR